MRQVRVATFVSLDGVMQAPGVPTEDPTGGFRFGGWTAPHADAVTGEVMGGIFARPFDLLLGRRTYEIFAAHWPYMGDNPIAERFNACTKYVATRSSQPLTWRNSLAIHDAARDVAALKAGEGPDLLIHGSGDLLQTLFAAGLVDRLTLLTYPVVLGHGKRLFRDGAAPGALKLIDSRTSGAGVVVAVYEPAGEVPVGAFGVPDPIPAEEIARRERWARAG